MRATIAAAGTGSQMVPRKSFSPQRHRDTEKTRKKNKNVEDFSVSLWGGSRGTVTAVTDIENP
jgi:hypothetical protein